MENIQVNNKCPLCKSPFDSAIRIPKILTTCFHTVCSICINTSLLEFNNTITCPICKTKYSNIRNADYFSTLRNLLSPEPLAEYDFIINSPNITFSPNGRNDYFHRCSSIRTSLKRAPSTQLCSIHTLPLDVICIDEKRKLCAQCALQSEHTNHSLLTDEQFMSQIDKLIDLFQEVDANLQQYNDKENISAKDVLEKIDTNMKGMIEKVEKVTGEMIKRIEEEREKVVGFLNFRRKEIKEKYENTSFDIKGLINSTNTWMDTVKNKLDLLNEINEPSTECIKLIDDEPKKNQDALLNMGQQLNDRYGFIQKTESTIKELKDFCDNGISVKDIKDVTDILKHNDDFPLKNHISSKIFEINENDKNISNLRLTKFTFETNNYNDNSLNNTNISAERNSMSLNTITESINNISISTSRSAKISNDLDNVNLKKTSNNDMNNIPPQQNSKKASFCSVELPNLASQKNTPERPNKLNVCKSNEKLVNKNIKKPKTPDKDRVVYIKGQLKNESANFSRIDLGDNGVSYLCQLLKGKQNSKYKEMKFVKSNLSNESVNELIKCIVSSNIYVSNLNLSSNGLSDKVGESLVYLLTNHHGLKSLYLTNNSFSFQMKEKIKSYSGMVKKGMENVKIFI